MSSSPKPKKTNTFKNFKKSISRTLKNLGIYTPKESIDENKESVDEKIKKEIEELLPKTPTTNIRASLRERDNYLKKVRHDLKKDIETEERLKKQLQENSRQVSNLKKRDNRRLSNLEKQEEIMKTLEKTGFKITTDAKTLKSLEKLPSATTPAPKTYKIPPNMSVHEADLEEILIDTPLPRLSYSLNKPNKKTGGKRRGKKGRKTQKVRSKKC